MAKIAVKVDSCNVCIYYMSYLKIFSTSYNSPSSSVGRTIGILCDMTFCFKKSQENSWVRIASSAILLADISRPVCSFREILGQSNFTLYKISSFWPKISLKLVIFPFWKKSSITWSQKDKGVASSWEWHPYFSILGPFYYIQTNFSILFCTRLYMC